MSVRVCVSAQAAKQKRAALTLACPAQYIIHMHTHRAYGRGSAAAIRPCRTQFAAQPSKMYLP